MMALAVAGYLARWRLVGYIESIPLVLYKPLEDHLDYGRVLIFSGDSKPGNMISYFSCSDQRMTCFWEHE